MKTLDISPTSCCRCWRWFRKREPRPANVSTTPGSTRSPPENPKTKLLSLRNSIHPVVDCETRLFLCAYLFRLQSYYPSYFPREECIGKVNMWGLPRYLKRLFNKRMVADNVYPLYQWRELSICITVKPSRCQQATSNSQPVSL